ncbi:MAG: alternative ribosome rescue aminoacyl-tRNA hydrolase ArfB [Saprospiraceae bacterium]
MDTKLLHTELQFQATRSAGPGGQHVNKVATQVVLRFDVNQSALLTDIQKERIKENLKNRITQDGILQLRCASSRSQFRNKQLVIQQFDELLTKALQPPTIRKKIKTPQVAPEVRLRNKKQHSEKKAARKKVWL